MSTLATLKKAAGALRHYPRGLRLIWATCPRLTSVWGVILVVQGVLPVLSVHLTRLLVDHLVGASRRGFSWPDASPVLGLALGIAGATLLHEVLLSAGESVRVAQAELVQDEIVDRVHRKSAELDMEYHENPAYQDMLHRVRMDAMGKPLGLLENTGAVLQNTITLVGMAALMLRYGWWLPVVLVLSVLPWLYVVLRHNRRYHAWWEGSTPRRRRQGYFDALLTVPLSAAEVRLFQLGNLFRESYRGIRRGLFHERVGFMKSQALSRLAATVCTVAVSGGTMGWMLLRALSGTVSIGDLTLFYQAFNGGQGLIRGLMGSLAEIYSNSLFLGSLFHFLELSPQIRTAEGARCMPERLARGIEFRKVTFGYPGSERPALEDFNLQIPAGRITAVVGPNGAGKSTLLKLLCRFYDPRDGSILVDGTDLREVDLESLRRRTTVLFQSPLRYEASVRENISWGDLADPPDQGRLEAAGQSAGAHEFVSRLPERYDTLLGRMYVQGTEISGGEWQRVALARAFLRKAPLIILDEPTSSMDPWSEAEWFERFRELARGRTAVVITHRFSIAMRADTICVMQGGRIVETGTHRELVARAGIYSESWSASVLDHAAGDPPLDEAPLESVGVHGN